MSNRALAGYWTLGTVGVVLLILMIFVVQTVTRDTSEAPEASVQRSTAATYVIAEGDSLASISQRTGVAVERIETLNPTLDPLALMPGERIRLRPPTAAERRRAAADHARQPREYVVQPGEGLLDVQSETGVDIGRLRKLNPRKDLDNLVPGMRLQLVE